MEDPEIQEIFDRFVNNASIEDSVKIQKLKQLLVIFSNRWAEERTISSVGPAQQKYRDKCYELLEYTDKSLRMVDKLKDSLLHEQAKSSRAWADAKFSNLPGGAPAKQSLLGSSEVFKYQEETKKLVFELREELKRSYEENEQLAEQLRQRSPPHALK